MVRSKSAASGPSSSQSRPKRPRLAVRNPNLFNSVVAEDNWNRFSKRGCIPGRVAKLTDFSTYGIPDLFNHMGWSEFVTISKPYYTHLVRLFYCNLYVSEDRTALHSFVKGTHIVLSVSDMCELLHIPDTENRIYFPNKGTFPESENIDTDAILASTCHTVPANRRPKTTNLNPVARIINRLVCFNFIPRGGHYDDVHSLQLFLCHCILTGVRINLGKLLFELILDSWAGSSVLPFGMLLTVVFEHFNVDLGGESIGRAMAPFDATTVRRMGLDGGDLLDEADDLGDDPEGQEDEEVHGEDEFLAKGASVRDINDLEYRMDEKFEAMKADLDEVKTEIGGMKQEMGDFKREMIARFDEIVEFLHTHTPPT